MYLHGMAQDLNDIKWKHRGIEAVFSVDEFRDAIHVYRRRVDDLKYGFSGNIPASRFSVPYLTFLYRSIQWLTAIWRSRRYTTRRSLFSVS